jgi:hypothetical protein
VQIYKPITGIPIYDTPTLLLARPEQSSHACYADVTALLSTLTNPQGVYTVADVSSSLGSNGTTGLAAGWTLVVYEDQLQLQNPLQLLMDLVLFLMLVNWIYLFQDL